MISCQKILFFVNCYYTFFLIHKDNVEKKKEYQCWCVSESKLRVFLWMFCVLQMLFSEALIALFSCWFSWGVFIFSSFLFVCSDNQWRWTSGKSKFSWSKSEIFFPRAVYVYSFIYAIIHLFLHILIRLFIAVKVDHPRRRLGLGIAAAHLSLETIWQLNSPAIAYCYWVDFHLSSGILLWLQFWRKILVF